MSAASQIKAKRIKKQGKIFSTRKQPCMPVKIRKKKLKTETYKFYVYKVLKQIYPDVGISENAMAIMDSFLNDIFQRIAMESSNLVKLLNKKTISIEDIQAAVKIVLPVELASHACSEGNKAVCRYNTITLLEKIAI